MNKILIVLLALTTLTSCSEYQKALKSEDPAKKAEVAKSLYDKGKYSKAIRLYEQVAPVYKGKPQGEQVFYYFSKSYYASKQYYLAGYQLENYAATYPKSEKREEAAFLSAECYYLLSPRYSLDQVDTEKALNKLQKFIDSYPDTKYMDLANQYVKELREKQEKKAFEIAKQYHDMGDNRLEYAVAIKALDNFIADYPGTPYKEAALFYRFESAYKLAMNSVPNKKQERLNFALNAYSSLLKFKSDTEFKERADKMFATIETELQQFSK
mgnify:CR=1 FL=1